MKRIGRQQHLARATGLDLSNLRFPCWLRAMGIEVSYQVARKECASIFDAKQGADSRHPGTELTPTRVGTCRRNSLSDESPLKNLRSPAGNHFPRVCKGFSNVQQFELLGESEGEYNRDFTTDWRSKPGVR
jgi:hypothetical protein